jgi:hypothetical protein
MRYFSPEMTCDDATELERAMAPPSSDVPGFSSMPREDDRFVEKSVPAV